MFIPLFPLELVVFPGQHLPLHIFEPRYKQLLGECRDDGITFGIAATVNGRLAEYGTEVRLQEVFKTYDTGEMDVLTQGIRAFHIIEYIRDVPDKLYSGAEVNCLENDPNHEEALRRRVIALFTELHEVLHNKPDLPHDRIDNLAFAIGHYVGFSLPQKIQLLAIASEQDRLRFVSDHIETSLPKIREAEQLKKKIGGNGHVKEFPRR